MLRIQGPKIFQKRPRGLKGAKVVEARNTAGGKGLWIYYPWNKVLVHTVSEDLYLKLRTSRNKNLITQAEQKRYREMTVGIAGLSVGSAVAEALVRTGGPKALKIADFDEIEISNLNRVQGGLPDVGQNKTWVVARRVWEVDPFARLVLYDRGLNQNNLKRFILSRPKLDVFIDEMDNLELKIEARAVCRQHRIPVLMATDNGDGVILDVERFDLEPRRLMFHGLEKKLSKMNLPKLTYKQWAKLATEIIGPAYLTARMKRSLRQIGKTISAVPQLGTGAMIAGAAVAYALRLLANGERLPSGKYPINLESHLK